MSLVSRTADLYYTFRFLKLLVTPWTEMDAYKLGIIDDNGTVLKKSAQLRTSEERTAYTLFHRLVFNIKKTLEKIPFGKSRIASYAAALYLLKENYGVSEESFRDMFDAKQYLSESSWMLSGNVLKSGRYTLANSVPFTRTGEYIVQAGTTIDITEDVQSVGTVIDVPVFEIYMAQFGQYITVAPGDLS